jgi:hypothetical protein
MNRLFYVLVLLFAALFVNVGVASADTLEFTLTGPVAAVFDMTVNSSGVLTLPIMSTLNAGFRVQPTNLTVNGAAAPTDFLTFYNGSTEGGGFAIFPSAFSMVAYASGPQIYGGDENAPTFAPGTFSLADGTAAVPVIGTYTLTITDLSTVSTPEPSVTILLAIGLLAVGLTVLRFKPNFGVSAS